MMPQKRVELLGQQLELLAEKFKEMVAIDIDLDLILLRVF